jgi:hypothetical protein
MNMRSPRLRAFSEESQKLKDRMLEIQRLRRLVSLAEGRAQNGQRKLRPAKRNNLRLV